MAFDDRLHLINESDMKHFGQASRVVTENEIVENENVLPIVMHERELMENIQNFVVTLVCGETGSGKSTQLPQFIYQAGKASEWKFRTAEGQGLIGIT